MGLVGPKQNHATKVSNRRRVVRRLLKRLENCYTQFSTVISTQATICDSTSLAGPAESSFKSVFAKLLSIIVKYAPKLNHENLIKTIIVKIDELSTFLQARNSDQSLDFWSDYTVPRLFGNRPWRMWIWRMLKIWTKHRHYQTICYHVPFSVLFKIYRLYWILVLSILLHLMQRIPVVILTHLRLMATMIQTFQIVFL